MPVLSKSLKISKALYLRSSTFLYKFIVLLLAPIGRNRAKKWILKAGFDAYGGWFLDLLFRRNEYLFSSYELEVKAFMRSRLRPGSTFLDIGAAIGCHIPYALKLVGDKGRVIAIEPNEDNVKSLLKMRAERKIHNLVIAPWAVSHKRGYQYFSNNRQDFTYIGQLDDVKKRHLKYVISDQVASERKYPVYCERLDNIAYTFGIVGKSADLVKIDIEGAEYEILRDPYLYMGHISALIVELHYALGSKEYHEIRENLEKNKGFTLFDITRHTWIQDIAKGNYYAHHLFYVK